MNEQELQAFLINDTISNLTFLARRTRMLVAHGADVPDYLVDMADRHDEWLAYEEYLDDERNRQEYDEHDRQRDLPTEGDIDHEC